MPNPIEDNDVPVFCRQTDKCRDMPLACSLTNRRLRFNVPKARPYIFIL